MPSSHLNDPEHWRERAKEAQAMAEEMADPVSTKCLLSLPIMSTWPNAPKTEGLEKSRKDAAKPHRRCVYVFLCQPLANACIAACRVASYPCVGVPFS
jgi:hypothetical protein